MRATNGRPYKIVRNLRLVPLSKHIDKSQFGGGRFVNRPYGFGGDLSQHTDKSQFIASPKSCPFAWNAEKQMNKNAVSLDFFRKIEYNGDKKCQKASKIYTCFVDSFAL